MNGWKEFNATVTTPEQDAWLWVAFVVFCIPLALYTTAKGSPIIAFGLVLHISLNFRRVFRQIRAGKQSQVTVQHDNSAG
jgi:hypothetical protein